MRSSNKTKVHVPLGFVLSFTREEFASLKWNIPGPSGNIGGYQRHENRLIELTNQYTLQCKLGPVDFTRCVRYCLANDTGGPNSRIRTACIPALLRLGIGLLRE